MAKQELPWPSGAQEVSMTDYDYIMAGKNGGPIGKILKANVRTWLNINARLMAPIKGGTAESPTVLPNGPANDVNGFKASPGRYSWSGNVYNATMGKEWVLWWENGTYSLIDMGDIPKGADGESILPLWTSKQGGWGLRSQVEYQGSNYVSLEASNTEVPGVGNKWEVKGGKDDDVRKVLKEFITDNSQPLNIDIENTQNASVNNSGVPIQDNVNWYQQVDPSGYSNLLFRGYPAVVGASNIDNFNTVIVQNSDNTWTSLEKAKNVSNNQVQIDKIYSIPASAKLVLVSWSNYQSAQGTKPIVVLQSGEGIQENAVKKSIIKSTETINKVLKSFVQDNSTTKDLVLNNNLFGVVNNQGEILGNTDNTNHIQEIDIEEDITYIHFKGYQAVVGAEHGNTFNTILARKADGTFQKLLGTSIYGQGQLFVDELLKAPVGTEKITISWSNFDVASGSIPYVSLITGEPVREDSVWKEINARVSGGDHTFNVKDFGARGNGLNDDRIPIQNAINACFNAGGGKVFFPYPDAFYNLGTSLTSAAQVVGDAATIHPNAQIVIPYNSDTTKNITIEMVGEFKINMADEAIVSVGRSNRGFIKGGYINAGTQKAAVIASRSPEWNTWGGKNYVQLHMEKLIVRSETKQNGLDIASKVNGIDMERITQFTFDDLKVDTTSVFFDSVRPIGTKGIIMPSVSNKMKIGEGNVMVVGYESGIVLGEHFMGGRVILLGCYNGLEFPTTDVSYHSCSIQHFNAECCVNMLLLSQSNQVLNIFNYDVEHHLFEEKWYNYQYDIKKTGGSGVVNIFNSQVTKSNVGNVNEFLVSGSPTYKVFTGIGAN